MMAALVSCNPPRYTTTLHSNLQPLTSSTLILLEGNYFNQPEDSARNGAIDCLWRQMKLRKSSSLLDHHDSLRILLRVRDSHTLYARLMEGEKELDQKKLKGRVKDGYFCLRRKYTFWGVPLIYWAEFELSTRLGTDGHGLYADSEHVHGGGVLLLMGGSVNDYSYYYHSVQNSPPETPKIK